MAKLTDKQEKFVQELIKGKSQREAYKIAYVADKMSDSAIDVQACKLLNNPKIALRYNQLHDRLVKEAEDEAIITAKEVLKELKNIAFDDISNYLSFRTEKTIVDYDNEGNSIMGYDTVIELKDSRTIDTRNISEISRGKDGQFKFKLYCRDNALVQLGRHLGIFEKDNTLEVRHTSKTIDEIEKYVNENDAGTD